MAEIKIIGGGLGAVVLLADFGFAALGNVQTLHYLKNNAPLVYSVVVSPNATLAIRIAAFMLVIVGALGIRELIGERKKLSRSAVEGTLKQETRGDHSPALGPINAGRDVI